MSCPADLLSGLVDGELDHASRERVLSHLLACPPCSTEVQALRALKTRLSWAGAETPLPSVDLTDRLLGMAVPGIEPVDRARPGTVRPVSLRPAGRSAASPRPRRLRRRTVGGLVVLGLSAAFALGGTSASPGTRAPIDPGTDQFVTDYVNATVEAPVVQPVNAALVSTR